MRRTSLELAVLEEDAVCEPVAVSELDGVPVLLGVDVCGQNEQSRAETRRVLTHSGSGAMCMPPTWPSSRESATLHPRPAVDSLM